MFLSILGFVAVAGAVMIATGLLLPVLRRRAILDHPGERSSHTTPTPRGGGLAVVGVVLLAWAAVQVQTPTLGLWPLIAAATGLAALSWVDDLRDLSAGIRLVGQIAAALVGLIWLHGVGPVFQGFLPPALDAAASVVLWVAFVNFFNFMDGIDGISAVEAGAIGTGVVVLAALGAGLAEHAPLAAVLVAGVLGFLRWNWHPAKVFLGDVGSVPIGFMLGGLLLALAGSGEWAAALILPLYYLADATATLVLRAIDGERLWQAHRRHFYQRAVRRGRSHAAVSTAILVANACLVALAAVSIVHPWLALALAGLVIAALLAWMVRWPAAS